MKKILLVALVFAIGARMLKSFRKNSSTKNKLAVHNNTIKRSPISMKKWMEEFNVGAQLQNPPKGDYPIENFIGYGKVS